MTQRTPILISSSATPAAKRGAVVRRPLEHLARSCAPPVAAVDEHQLRHRRACCESRAGRGTCRRTARRRADRDCCAGRRALRHGPEHLRRLAVAGDVHDAPVALQQRVDDRARVGAELRRVLGADQRLSPAAPSAQASVRALGHRVRLGARAGQARVRWRSHLRLADDEHARFGVGVDHLRAEVGGPQLAQQLGADRPGPRVAAPPRCSVSSSSHGMPAVPLSSSITISVVPPRNGSISTGHQQLEQRAADLRVAVLVVRGAAPPARAAAVPASPARAPRCARAWCRACRRSRRRRAAPRRVTAEMKS